MRVVVDELACEGYGKCERIAPDLFGLDEEGIAHVLTDSNLNPEQLHRARAAVTLCPAKAIRLIDTSPGEKSNE